MDDKPFDTREALLALCLILAGQEPLDEKTPCFNLFDEEILAKLGHRGKPLFDAAMEAWEQEEKGDVGYVLKSTPRLFELIRAYRDQCKQIEESDVKSREMILALTKEPMQADEIILRIACVILKTRGQFLNVWKQMIPLLRVPVDGKAKHFDTTAISNGKVVEAKGVQRPGFKIISLNISDEHRKAMKL